MPKDDKPQEPISAEPVKPAAVKPATAPQEPLGAAIDAAPVVPADPEGNRAPAPPVGRVKIARVQFSVVGRGYGYSRAAGAWVHLDEPIGGGRTVADIIGTDFPAEWLADYQE